MHAYTMRGVPDYFSMTTFYHLTMPQRQYSNQIILA